MEPTSEEMQEGIKSAEEIVDYVISLLPDELQNILKSKGKAQQNF
jgi:hypothetical protein